MLPKAYPAANPAVNSGDAELIKNNGSNSMLKICPTFQQILKIYQSDTHEHGGELVFDHLNRLTHILNIKKGEDTSVNYTRNTNVHFHTHPKQESKFIMPSPFDICCLCLADAYVYKENKIGLVIADEGIYSIEICHIMSSNV